MAKLNRGDVGYVASLLLWAGCARGMVGGMAMTTGPVVARTTTPATLTDPDGSTRMPSAEHHSHTLIASPGPVLAFT